MKKISLRKFARDLPICLSAYLPLLLLPICLSADLPTARAQTTTIRTPTTNPPFDNKPGHAQIATRPSPNQVPHEQDWFNELGVLGCYVGTDGLLNCQQDCSSAFTSGCGGGGSGEIPQCYPNSGSGTAYTCTVPATNPPAVILYPDVANTGASATLNVNNTQACFIAKYGGTTETLEPSDLALSGGTAYLMLIVPAPDNTCKWIIASQIGDQIGATVYVNGGFIGTEPGINFNDGANTTWSAADDPTDQRVNLHVDASGGTSGCSAGTVQQGYICAGPPALDALSPPILDRAVGYAYGPTSVAATLAQPITAGQQILVAAACSVYPSSGPPCGGTGTASNFADSLGDTYTLLGPSISAGYWSVQFAIATAISTGNVTVTLSNIATTSPYGLQVFRTYNIGAYDTNGVQSTLSGTQTATANITTSTDGNLLIGIGFNTSGSTVPILSQKSSDWVNFGTSGTAIGGWYFGWSGTYQAVAGANSLTWSSTPVTGPASGQAVAIAAFSPAGPWPLNGPPTFRPLYQSDLPSPLFASGLIFGTNYILNSSTPPTSGQCFGYDGTNIVGVSCGGGGTPGAPDLSLQGNNGGAFAGIPGSSFDPVNGPVTLAPVESSDIGQAALTIVADNFSDAGLYVSGRDTSGGGGHAVGLDYVEDDSLGLSAAGSVGLDVQSELTGSNVTGDRAIGISASYAIYPTGGVPAEGVVFNAEAPTIIGTVAPDILAGVRVGNQNINEIPAATVTSAILLDDETPGVNVYAIKTGAGPVDFGDIVKDGIDVLSVFITKATAMGAGHEYCADCDTPTSQGAVCTSASDHAGAWALWVRGHAQCY